MDNKCATRNLNNLIPGTQIQKRMNGTLIPQIASKRIFIFNTTRIYVFTSKVQIVDCGINVAIFIRDFVLPSKIKILIENFYPSKGFGV